MFWDGRGQRCKNGNEPLFINIFAVDSYTFSGGLLGKTNPEPASLMVVGGEAGWGNMESNKNEAAFCR